MTRSSLKHMNCSIAQFADIFGDKWVLLILRAAFAGKKTFSEFERSLGAAKNVLTERLTHLVREGVLDRVQTRPGVDRYVYELTPKGKALFPVIVAMIQWGDKWVFGSQGEPYRVVDTKTRSTVQIVEVISRNGQMLELDDVEFVTSSTNDEYDP